ncbi:MAG: transporter related [Holophagaceae bacterium]|nr:transporter related [Holophagaceae bacterium]
MMAIEATGLTVGERLKSLDLALPKGCLAAVMGPNGAGKSTLLQALAGLLPAKGRVHWQGRDLRKIPILDRGRLLAWLPQESHAEFAFPVRDVVVQGRYAWDDEDQGVDRVLERLDLCHLAQRPVTRLSGGERQRVFLARALATEAPIQLWDEPVSQLDARHALEVLRIGRQLADQGATVLMSVHDLRLVRFMDQVLVLKNGDLRACGAPDSVFTPELILEVFGVQARWETAMVLELP